MLKQIQVKISKIKYSGDSVGDDIRIEVECLDKFVGFNKKLKCGSERDANDDVGIFFVDGASFLLPVNVKIIERDLIFNDVGSKKMDFKVNLKSNSPQSTIYKIEVQESRNFISKKKAFFEVTLEASVSDMIMYVCRDEGGWLNALPGNSKKIINLPLHLKVRMERTENGRQYFSIMEGALQGIRASVKLNSDGEPYFSSKNTHTAPVSITYSISKKTARFRNKVYATIDYPDSPWKKGIYDIEIPDYSHGGGHNYPEANLSSVWFLIGHEGERYFHLGKYSLGCITLTEIHKWDDLCEILMKARKGDGRSIGALEVID
ncbi:MAG: hypothetical protein V1770_00860 [bacterium]